MKVLENHHYRLSHLMLIVLALFFLAGSQPSPELTLAQTAQTTALVNVIPMDTERVLENQTVIVEGDRITAIGPVAEVTVPDGAEVVEGNGAYLMPGLADMHMHLQLRDPDSGHLVLYLAEGTTTVRSFNGQAEELQWREQVKNGELLGPTILTAGSIMLGTHDELLGYLIFIRIFRIFIFILPLLLGGVVYLLLRYYGKLRKVQFKAIKNRRTFIVAVSLLLLVGLVLTLTKTPAFNTILPVLDGRGIHYSESPAQAVKEVRRQYEQGFDFVKPYDSLQEDEYLVIIAEANKLGMYVAGHALDQVSLETIMTSGIDEIAHIDELNFYHWRGSFGEADFSLDYEAIPQTVALMKENKVNIVSNLALDEVAFHMIADTPGVLAAPEYRTVRPELLEAWRTHGRPLAAWAKQGHYRRDMEFPFFKTLVKAIHDAGIIVTIATDTGSLTEGSLPGQIHRELEILVEAGFSNFEALEAGTKHAGTIVNRMGRDGSFGTVEVGQRAALMLLEENPLEDVGRTRNRVGVMARGQWFTQAELDALVDAFVATY